MKKKIIALGLAAVMACTPVAVFADTSTTSPAEGGDTGTGSVEGIVELDVFSVDLPTDAQGTFDFILDPQELIFNTEGAAHSDLAPAEGTTVVFSNYTDGAVSGLSDTSDEITVKNLGSVKVDVTVSATVTTDLAMSADNTFADDGVLYLALTTGDDVAAVDATDKVAELTTTLDGIAAENFEYGYADGAYTYSLASSYDKGTAPSYSFALTGAADSAATWVGDETASVDVVWTLEKYEEEVEPTVAYANYNNAAFWVNTTSDDGTTADETGAFTDADKLTNVTIAEGDGEAATVEYALSSDWIKISWDQAAAAGATWNSTGANDYTITFTYDGVDYVATCQAGSTVQ